MAQPFRVIIREKDKQKTKSGTYNVKIRLSHKGECRDIGTDIYVSSDQIENGTIVDHPSATLYNTKLRNLLNLFEQKRDRLGRKIKDMSSGDLAKYLREVDREGRDPDFFFMAEQVIGSHQQIGQASYVNILNNTIDHLKAFSGSSLLFAEITPEYLERFEIHLKSKKKTVNTISIHMRNIRMIYNRGVNAGKADLSDYPFRRFKIKQAKSRDRDMDIEDLRLFRDAELELKSHRRARDLFMLSFYMCGVNFKDLLYAQKTDIRKGRLVVNRIKTGQPLSIKITPQAQEIIDRYAGKKYMLSILEEKLKTARKDRKTIIYKDVTDQTNAKLKKIATDLEIPYKLSTYFARHTWSSIAFNECGASEEIIGLALGHASPRKITAGYIRKKYELVDQVNEAVIAILG